jgi:hypothetical protein
MTTTLAPAIDEAKVEQFIHQIRATRPAPAG